MTITINIEVPQGHIEDGNAALYLAKAMTAIGYTRFTPEPTTSADEPAETDEVLADEGPNYAAMKAAAEAQETKPEPEEEVYYQAVKPIRYLGKSGSGKGRRTKEEIALDEEAEALLKQVGLTEAKFNAALDKANGDWGAVMADLRAAAKGQAEDAEPKANISTGEERVDPAQADEKLTHDDVRAALGDYAAKFGMPAAQKNGPKLMGADKISAIPDEQDALRAAVEAIRERIEKGEA